MVEKRKIFFSIVVLFCLSIFSCSKVYTEQEIETKQEIEIKQEIETEEDIETPVKINESNAIEKEILLYPMEINGEYGFINQFGKMIIAPRFLWAHESTSGVAIGIDNNVMYFLSTAGEELFFIENLKKNTRINRFFSDDLLAYYDNETGKWGFLDKTGTWVIEPEYESVGNFSEGYANVKYSHDEMGFYINKKNEPVFGDKRFTGDEFKNGYAYVWKNLVDDFYTDREVDGSKFQEKIYGSFGAVINKSGNFVIPHILNLNTVFSDGLFRVSYKNIENEIDEIPSLIGYMNLSGETIIETQFKTAHHFVDGVAIARKHKNKYGLINKQGEFILDEIYADLRTMSNGLILFSLDGQKFGYIDKSGNEIIPAEFDFANSFEGQLAFIRIGDVPGYVTKDGEVFLATDYE